MVEPLRYHGPCDGCCIPAIEATEFLEAHVNELESAIAGLRTSHAISEARNQKEHEKVVNLLADIRALEIFLQAQGYHKCKVDGWTRSRCSCEDG